MRLKYAMQTRMCSFDSTKAAGDVLESAIASTFNLRLLDRGPGHRSSARSREGRVARMTKNFITHGFHLLVVTSVAVMYNPHTNAFGFNPNAKSALIVGGSFAVISFFWAYIYSRNARRAAIIGGIITTLLLFAGTIPRAVGEWGGVASGDAVRWFAALTISLVIVGSIPLFGALLRAVRTPSR